MTQLRLVSSDWSDSVVFGLQTGVSEGGHFHSLRGRGWQQPSGSMDSGLVRLLIVAALFLLLAGDYAYLLSHLTGVFGSETETGTEAESKDTGESTAQLAVMDPGKSRFSVLGVGCLCVFHLLRDFPLLTLSTLHIPTIVSRFGCRVSIRLRSPSTTLHPPPPPTAFPLSEFFIVKVFV